MKSWIRAASAALIIAAPICFSVANGQEATTNAQAEPKAVAAPVAEVHTYRMQLVRVIYTKPQEWMFVVGQAGFKSMDDLKRFISTMRAGSILEWSVGDLRFGDEPLLSSEKDMAEFKKFCESKNVKLIFKW